MSRILLEDRESVSASKREEEEAEMDRSARVNLAMDCLCFSGGKMVGVRLPMLRRRAFAMPHPSWMSADGLLALFERPIME